MRAIASGLQQGFGGVSRRSPHQIVNADMLSQVACHVKRICSLTEHIVSSNIPRYAEGKKDGLVLEMQDLPA